MKGSDEPISPKILDEAAAWLMRLHGGESSEADRHACEHWCQLSPEHARAWARAERLMQRLGGLPPELAMPTLGRERSLDRRRAIKGLAVLLAVAPATWLAWREKPWQDWLADQSTAVGEQREFALPDGSRLTLNTDSAVDLCFDTNQRLVRLLYGELLVASATDSFVPARPLRVLTDQGSLRALGTRFSVRQEAGRTRFAILSGAVEISPRQGGSHIVQAGQGGLFDARGMGTLVPANGAAIAWTHGMLMADRMPLGEFVAELSRYHPGVVRCDPAVAALPVSGAYPIRDRARTLAMLQDTYSLRVSTVTDYWITLGPA